MRRRHISHPGGHRPAGVDVLRPGTGGLPVVLHSAGLADRSDRQGSLPGTPPEGCRRALRDSMVIYLAGLDPRKGNIPFLSVEANPGGWGAFATGDGQDGLINNVNGGFKDMPVEGFECKYPVQIHHYRFRPDPGGPGKFRGGCGLDRAYHLEADCGLYLWFERSKTPAWGLFGGHDAIDPSNIIDGNTSWKLLNPPKATIIALHA